MGLKPNLSILLSSLLLSGCALKRAQYKPPTAPAVNAASKWNTPLAGGETGETADNASLSKWWSVFNDPTLTSLEERAIKANLDLSVAESQIAQARATRDYSAANLYPTVTGSLSSSGTKNSLRSGGSVTHSNSANLDASWEPDFFGSLHKSVAAQEATIQYQQENLRNVMVTLTGDVALNYIDVRSYQAQLAVTRGNLVRYRETYEMTLSKRESGLTSDLDVQQALGTVKSTEALIPSLETQLRQAYNALAVLLNQAPGSLDAELEPVKPVPVVPSRVAVGIPGDLIRRRPDVRGIERQYLAQWMQVGVARANLYPTFSLSGTFAFGAQNFLNMLTPASIASTVAGSVQQTLLNRRALKAQVHIQNALLDQDELSYESAVLGAVRDVEDALKAFGSEQTRRESLASAAESAENAAEMSRDLYASGLKDFLTVLDSERTLLSAQNNLVQSDATVAADLVRLYKAMGGGWQ